LARICLQTLDEVCACAQYRLIVPMVVDGFRARLDDLQRDSTPVEAPRSLLGWNFDLKSFVGVSIHCLCTPIPTIDFCDASPELACQCFCQGCLHNVLESAQTVSVCGVLVVFCQSTIALLVYFDDFEQNTFATLFDNDSHLKEIIFNATEFNYGLPFRFQKTAMTSDNRLYAYYGNKQVNMPPAAIREVRLADVIAASSCFPMGFEPINFPHDFRHKESPVLDELKESYREDKWGKKCKFPIGLMDGGMVDNQGIDSVINAEYRMSKYTADLAEFASQDVKAVDLYIISDVSSPYMNPYVTSIEKKPSGWRKLSFRRFFLLGILLEIAAILLVIAAICSNNALVTFLTGFFASLFMLAGTLCFFLSNIFRWAVKKFEVPEYFTKKLKVFSRMKFGVYETLITNRITSVISMVSQVFMKQVRRQEYGRVYNDKEWRPRLIMNGIYELSSKLMKETDENEREYISTTIDPPSEKLIAIADQADSMGTTLWFTSEELIDNAKKRNMLNALIASGQFTGCYNLLIYIEKTLWGDDYNEDYKKYSQETRNKIENLHAHLHSDWKKFNDDPFWMLNEQYRIA